MDKRTEEMIALGAAYAVNCRPCLEFHRQKAAEAGLAEDEMLAAIEVAEAVKTGAYKKTREIAVNLFGYVQEEKCCPSGSECCK